MSEVNEDVLIKALEIMLADRYPAPLMEKCVEYCGCGDVPCCYCDENEEAHPVKE